ncbi:PIN-like domain-containing protein [Oceanobacillus kimchii]|uniref:PIN like domain-containing protein n=1 Tax=Oceanobacillus kimchii TaxID=746691 RepID=A0ABQ5TRN1_9BACI|nr:PIN domain-containing protein [Oceanobacillus kimchii]GLO68473.1 hypothetical protein MACH08_42570 [Oceanobacillus kimchii]
MKKLNPNEFENLWGTKPLIIIDTSSIMDLYRYAPSKSEKGLTLLKNLTKNQIFIPSQVYKEYNKNKQNVISKENQKIKYVKKVIDDAVTQATNSIEKEIYEFKRREYPNIEGLENEINKLMKELSEKAIEYNNSNKDEVKKNKLMLKNDKVEPFIRELKEAGCIGEGFSSSSLLDIYSEGERRYKYKIPPGYKDASDKDKSDPTRRQKFGDLVVWKELLNKANTDERNIIYLTSDKKEWITNAKNKSKYPDPLLEEEFKEYSKKDIYFWELNDLVDMLSEYNEEDHLIRNIKLNEYELFESILDTKDMFSIIESDESKLSFYLIHSGELQEHVPNPLENVEITDNRPPEINEFFIEIVDEELIFEGSFYISLDLSITETLSRECSNIIEARVEVSGNFYIKVNINPDEILKDGNFNLDWIDFNTLKTKSGGFSILDYDLEMDEYDLYSNDRCIGCGKRNAIYFTNNDEPICRKCSIHYYTCPKCGKLFKEPFSGPVCDTCESSYQD